MRMKQLLRGFVSVLAFTSVALWSSSAGANFHLAVIDEVLTSYDGDDTVQFVDIRMLAGGQNIVGGSKLSAFDASGSFLGVVLTVSGNVSNGSANGHWVMGSSSFAIASGLTPDKTFSGPLYLPTSGGMVCWGKPGNETIPNQYVDCVAYGTYSGPTNAHIGSPTPLDAVGHSLQRQSETDDNLTDFSCGDPATPDDNSGGSASMPATTPCPVCGNSTTEVSEECDDTDDAACPGQCQVDCTCPPPVCGDDTVQGIEECDGVEDSACPGDCQSNCTCPDHQAVLAKKLLVKDPTAGVNTSKRRVVLLAKEVRTDDTLAGDPLADGATLTFDIDGTTPTMQVFTLPGGAFTPGGSGWKPIRDFGFKYLDPTGVNGPVKLLIVKRTPGGVFLLKAVLKGQNGAINLAPPNTGAGAAATLLLHGGDRYCASFGGAAGGIVKRDDSKTYLVVRPTTEGACPP